MKKFLLSVLAASTFFVNPAYAATAITSIGSGTVFSAFSNDETVGWAFTANSNLSVTDLGWFSPSGADLVGSHQIGIWTTGGGLLGSLTIGPGAVAGTGFRYASLSPFILSAGQQYVIGGRDTAVDGDNYISNVNSITTSPAITFNGTALSVTSSGFAFPGNINPLRNGRFGPNFQFVDLGVGAVPEPATWAFMIFGFGAIGGAMRRQRKANVKVSYA